MACSQFMLVAMLLVVRGERRRIDAKGFFRKTDLERNRLEKNVSTVGGSYRHHQPADHSSQPSSPPIQQELTQVCAGCKFIHALIRWSVASLSLPEPTVQRDLFAEDCSFDDHQCLAVASTVPSLRCRGLGLSESLLTFLQGWREEGKKTHNGGIMPKKTMEDMYHHLIEQTNAELIEQTNAEPYANLESMNLDEWNFYVISPLNGSLLVPSSGIISRSIPLFFGNMKLKSTECSTIFPPKGQNLTEGGEDAYVPVFGGLDFLAGDSDDSLDPRQQRVPLCPAASHVYDNCVRLAIVMSGKEERHFDRQKEMYDELLKYDIDEQCIVVFAYSDEAMDTWKENTGETWEPRWVLPGSQFSRFMDVLAERSRLNVDALYDSVFLTYVGHGSRGSLSIAAAGGLTREKFSEYTRVLNKLAKTLFVSLEACHSSSMLSEETAQFVPHGIHLYASRSMFDKWEWKERRAMSEFQRLFRHYPGLEERFIKLLISFAYSKPGIEFGFEGFKHDIDMAVKYGILGYEDTFNWAEFEEAVGINWAEFEEAVDINQDQIQVHGNFTLTSGLARRFLETGELGVLPLLQFTKQFTEWQAEMQTLEKHFLAKESAAKESKEAAIANKKKNCTQCTIS